MSLIPSTVSSMLSALRSSLTTEEARSRSAPVLALSGDRQQLAEWRKQAENLGVGRVAFLPEIPTDRRHGSKVDPKALQAALHRLEG